MTLTAYENAIRDFTTAHGVSIGRGKVQRLAKRLHKEQTRPTGDALARVLDYADPTGETAVRNVMRGAAA